MTVHPHIMAATAAEHHRERLERARNARRAAGLGGPSTRTAGPSAGARTEAQSALPALLRGMRRAEHRPAC